MTFSKLTTRLSGNGGQFSSRGRKVDMFIVHHAASTSVNNVLNMMATGSRQVSANYVVDGVNTIGVVPEEYRAWTSGDAAFDGRSITVETINDRVGPTDMTWTISEASYISLAKLIADCSTRYGFPLDRDHVVGHRELRSRWGASYSTACPSGINLDRVVQMAKEFQAGSDQPTPTIPNGDDMYLVRNEGDSRVYLVTSAGYRWIDKDTVSATQKITGRSVANVTANEFNAFVNDLHELIRNGPVLGDDDYDKIATSVKNKK